MPTFSLKYQTAENLPAPYAHAIEINGKFAQNQVDETPLLELSFELTYLGREDFTEEELLEEGFTINDDFELKEKPNRRVIFDEVGKNTKYHALFNVAK